MQNATEDIPHLAEDLRQLASEKSSEKRVELLRRLTDVYLEQPDEAITAQQYLFNELINNLMDKIAPGDRAPASEQLARHREIPDNVARLLALDKDIAIAGSCGIIAVSPSRFCSTPRSRARSNTCRRFPRAWSCPTR